MGIESVLLAKTAALKKNFDSLPKTLGRTRFLGSIVEPLFDRYTSILKGLKHYNADLYGDIPEIQIPKEIGHSSDGPLYEKVDIDPLIQTLDYILELSSNVRIGDNIENKERVQRVFISHGKSKEWHVVQNYLEKDLGIATLELAQEPNLGRTVLQKLDEEAKKCSVAVIVMTGDDMTHEGEIRARENVMHEIGYFQGKYGLNKIVLLHEQGVNIPSNIIGLVYISFPKDMVEAAMGALAREMKVLIVRQ